MPYSSSKIFCRYPRSSSCHISAQPFWLLLIEEASAVEMLKKVLYLFLKASRLPGHQSSAVSALARHT